MSRQIIGSLEYPAGTNFNGTIEARHIEGNTVTVPQSISEFTVTDSLYDFTLENGSYQFSIKGVISEGSADESRVKIGLGIVNDGAPVDLLTLIGLSEPLSSPVEDLINERGLPSGGTTGQHLSKTTDNDYEVEWVDALEEAPIDGQQYARQDADWVVVTGGGGGASTFVGLDDTPASYVGDADKVVRVNPTANALVFDNLNKSDVGLDQVDNTSDLNKPISTATQTALDGKVDTEAGKGLSDENYTLTEKNKLSGVESGAQVNTVTSVNTQTGAVVLDKNDVGLGNVDNTSDADKPISTATQTALDGKEDDLGNPTIDGQVLSSTIAGGRSWITPSGGGASTFTGLTDTPASYSGEGGKVVKVNVGETGLEFADEAGGDSTFTSPSFGVLQDGMVDVDDTAVMALYATGLSRWILPRTGGTFGVSKYVAPRNFYFEYLYSFIPTNSASRIYLSNFDNVSNWNQGFVIEQSGADINIYNITGGSRPRGRTLSSIGSFPGLLANNRTVKYWMNPSVNTLYFKVSTSATVHSQVLSHTNTEQFTGYNICLEAVTTSSTITVDPNFGHEPFTQGVEPNTTPVSMGATTFTDPFLIWDGTSSTVAESALDFPVSVGSSVFPHNNGEYILEDDGATRDTSTAVVITDGLTASNSIIAEENTANTWTHSQALWDGTANEFRTYSDVLNLSTGSVTQADILMDRIKFRFRG